MNYVCFIIAFFLSIAQVQATQGDTYITLDEGASAPSLEKKYGTFQTIRDQLSEQSSQAFLDRVGEEAIKYLQESNAVPTTVYRLLANKGLLQEPNFYKNMVEGLMFKNYTRIFASDLVGLLNLTKNLDDFIARYPELKGFKLESSEVQNLLHFTNHFRYASQLSCCGRGSLLGELALTYDVALDTGYGWKAAYLSWSIDPASTVLPIGFTIAGFTPFFVGLGTQSGSLVGSGFVCIAGTIAVTVAGMAIGDCIWNSYYGSLYQTHWLELHHKHQSMRNLRDQIAGMEYR